MRAIECLAIAAAVALWANGASGQTLGIATTPPGSLTHSTGAAIAKVLVEKAGLQARIQPSASHAFMSVEQGEIEMSIGSAFDIIFFNRGTGDYENTGGPKKNIRMIARLMPLLAGMMVQQNSPIKTLADLKGKRLGSGFGSQKAVERVLIAYLKNAGLTYDDVRPVPAQNVVVAADDFAQGKTDVFIFALGSAKVKQVAASVGGLKTLPADISPEAMARVQEIVPGSHAMVVEPSPRYAEVREPTPMIAYDLTFFANANVPEEVIYKVTKALHGNKKDLAGTFPALNAFDPDKMAKKYGEIQHHPGAVKLYKEAGLWPPKE